MTFIGEGWCKCGAPKKRPEQSTQGHGYRRLSTKNKICSQWLPPARVIPSHTRLPSSNLVLASKKENAWIQA